MAYETNLVVDARGIFLPVVRHHDEGLIAPPAERINNILDEPAVDIVETMERFVEDYQLRVLNESPCQQCQALLTALEFEEGASLFALKSEHIHPELTPVDVVAGGFDV